VLRFTRRNGRAAWAWLAGWAWFLRFRAAMVIERIMPVSRRRLLAEMAETTADLAELVADMEMTLAFIEGMVIEQGRAIEDMHARKVADDEYRFN